MEMRIYRADSQLTHAALFGRLDHNGVTSLEEGTMVATRQEALSRLSNRD